MKALNEKRRDKSRKFNDKLSEKQERIKELQQQHDKERNKLIKKFENFEKKKNILEKVKEENLFKMKTSRDNKFLKIKLNKSMIELKEKERIENILYDEEEKIYRVLTKDNRCNSMKSLCRNKTIGFQKEREQKIKRFLKAMSALQSQSIIKKSERQRRQIYINKVREEERKRKEEEEKRLEK